MGAAGRLSRYDPVHPDASAPCEAMPAGGRLKLWEIGGGFHCSILGTCLATPDLHAVARRLRITPAAGATDYEIHGWFVQQATREGPVARALQRLLDHRHSGALRQVVQRLEDVEGLDGLWEECKASGRIAGVYWALLSNRRVPAALHSRAFGEVHMMSHLQGTAIRDHAARNDRLERDNVELRARLARATRSLQDTHAALEDRDRRLATLVERPVESAVAGVDQAARRGSDRLERRLAKCARSLVGARARCRALEAEVDRLTQEIATLRPPPARTRLKANPGTPKPAAAIDGVRRLLYVGGRPGLVPHLRDVAERRQVSLEHHDGGKEETLQRIDDLVERADAVLCPIDCVSHSACLRVKHLCQRHDKPFLPLKSSSRSCFARALLALGLSPSTADGPSD